MLYIKEEKMKLAIIGSRNLIIEHLEDYLPDNVTEIVSGGAKGIDRLAAEYAKKHQLPLTEFLPDYARYGRGAPFIRNRQIALPNMPMRCSHFGMEYPRERCIQYECLKKWEKR